MTKHPILFSGPMVRAILDGKTQTRRIVKFGIHEPDCLYPNGECGTRYDWGLAAFGCQCDACRENNTHWFALRCPYGAPGDRLWVRETFGEDYTGITEVTVGQNQQTIKTARLVYRADGHKMGDCGTGWKPSIHMPRWASRITLEVKNIRAERVQEITEEDARAEGITPCDCDDGATTHYKTSRGFSVDTAQEAFKFLWDDLNAKRDYGWTVNPWCWVISFERIR